MPAKSAHHINAIRAFGHPQRTAATPIQRLWDTFHDDVAPAIARASAGPHGTLAEFDQRTLEALELGAAELDELTTPQVGAAAAESSMAAVEAAGRATSRELTPEPHGPTWDKLGPARSSERYSMSKMHLTIEDFRDAGVTLTASDISPAMWAKLRAEFERRGIRGRKLLFTGFHLEMIDDAGPIEVPFSEDLDDSEKLNGADFSPALCAKIKTALEKKLSTIVTENVTRAEARYRQARGIERLSLELQAKVIIRAADRGIAKPANNQAEPSATEAPATEARAGDTVAVEPAPSDERPRIVAGKVLVALQSDVELNAPVAPSWIAERFGLDLAVLNKRLERWRRKHDDCCVFVSERKPREPKYLYYLKTVMPVIDDLRAASSEQGASSETSP
jgi:hypothetical protein